jgi:hypothetical protein
MSSQINPRAHAHAHAHTHTHTRTHARTHTHTRTHAHTHTRTHAHTHTRTRTRTRTRARARARAHTHAHSPPNTHKRTQTHTNTNTNTNKHTHTHTHTHTYTLQQLGDWRAAPKGAPSQPEPGPTTRRCAAIGPRKNSHRCGTAQSVSPTAWGSRLLYQLGSQPTWAAWRAVQVTSRLCQEGPCGWALAFAQNPGPIRRPNREQVFEWTRRRRAHVAARGRGRRGASRRSAAADAERGRQRWCRAWRAALNKAAMLRKLPNERSGRRGSLLRLPGEAPELDGRGSRDSPQRGFDIRLAQGPPHGKQQDGTRS